MPDDSLKEIKFDRKILDLVNQISNITPKILFTKNENKVEAKIKGKQINIILKFTSDKFGFHGDELGFADYKKFHKFLDSFETPTLSQSDDYSIVIQNNSNKLFFKTASPTIFNDSNIWTNPRIPKESFKFELSKDKLENIRDMANKLSAEGVKIKIDGSDVLFAIINSDDGNRYEMSMKLENDVTVPIDTTIKAETFKLIPLNSYTVKFFGKGAVGLCINNEDFDLEFYTGQKIN